MRMKVSLLATIACLVCLIAPIAQAQSADPSPLSDQYRDPSTATLYGVLFPGAGHMYAGDKKRGLTLTLIALGGIFGGSIGSSLSCLSYTSGCSYTPFILGLLAYTGAWGYGIYDAGNAARRTNERNGFTASLKPTVVLVSGVSLRPGLALRMRW